MAELPTESFGPFLIIQLSVAVAVAVTTILVAYRGFANKAHRPPDIEMFFDGPIGKFLEMYRDHCYDVKQAREDAKTHHLEQCRLIREMISRLDDLNNRRYRSRPSE